MDLTGFSLTTSLLHGAVYGALGVLLLLATALLNPRIWISDLPAEVRVLLPPLTADERRLRVVVGVLLFIFIIGGLFFSALRIRDASGGVSFAAAALHTYVVFLLGLLADTFVLDWLILSVMRPSFTHIPGTEGYEDTFLNLAYHLRGTWKGLVGGAIVASLVAYVVSR